MSNVRKLKLVETETTKINPSILYSPESERAILSCLFQKPDFVMERITGEITQSDFFNPMYQEIFATMLDFYEHGQMIDIITLHENFTRRGIAEQMGSPGILADIAGSHGMYSNVKAYIKEVRDKSILRGLQRVCATVSESVVNSDEEPEILLQRAEKEVFNLSVKETKAKEEPFFQSLDAVIENVVDWAKDGERLRGLNTGFKGLNRLTTGWMPGDVTVVAARPGMGKTSLGLAFAKAIVEVQVCDYTQRARAGDSVLFFSAEMPKSQIILRLLSMQSGVGLQTIRKGSIGEKDREAIEEARSYMREWPLIIDDSSGLDISQVRSRGRRAKRKHNIKAIIIDYLQLLHCKKYQKDRQEEVASISRGCKEMAKELEVPVIVLAQLNRPKEGQESKEPKLHNLRESGAIEQDADNVILLHEKDSDEEQKSIRKVDAIIAKQRNGPIDKVYMDFYAWKTLFTEREE